MQSFKYLNQLWKSSNVIKRIKLILLSCMLVAPSFYSNAYASNLRRSSASINYEGDDYLLSIDYDDNSELVDTQPDEHFFSEATQLAIDNWDDGYVGEIVLTVGVPYMFIDDIQQRIDVSPVVVNNELMLPVTDIIEETGGSIIVDEIGQNVTIEDERMIELEVDTEIMYIDGDQQYIDTAPVIINDRVMLPVDIISEELGFEVNWDFEAQQVTLTRDFQTRRLIVRTSGEVDFFNSVTPVSVVSGESDDLTVLQFATIYETQEAYDWLSNSENVVWVEPDRVILTDYDIEGVRDLISLNISNHYSWGVFRTGANQYAEFLRNSGIDQRAVVAVLDTGVDANHSFVRNRLAGWEDTITNSPNPQEDHPLSHGTNVIGIIVDSTPGVNVQVLPVKIMRDCTAQGCITTSLAISNGIRLATRRNVNVINMSFDLARNPNNDAAIHDSIQYAINSNVTVIASAGNRSSDIGIQYPYSHRDMMLISAVDGNDVPADRSNFGTPVNIAAPGVGIVAAVRGGSFESRSGSSVAVPHVSAAAAMYIIDNSEITPLDLQTAFRQYVDIPENWQYRFGAGILNMRHAIPPERPKIPEPPPPEKPEPPPPETPEPPPPETPEPPPPGTPEPPPPGTPEPPATPTKAPTTAAPTTAAPTTAAPTTAAPTTAAPTTAAPTTAAPTTAAPTTAPQQPPEGTAPPPPETPEPPPLETTPEEPERPDTSGTLKLTRSNWNLNSLARRTAVSVISNQQWTISSDADWLSFSNGIPTNQTGNGMFRIKATANRGATARTGRITVTAPGAPTQTIYVTQTSAARTLTLSDRTWNLDSSASNLAINVTSGRRWRVRSSVSWLTISDIYPANQAGNGSFIINATANRGATSRRGRIAVKALGGVSIQTIYVTQAPVNNWNSSSSASNIKVSATFNRRLIVSSQVKF